MGAWAVGSVRDPGAWRTYIEHWRDDAWKHVASPNASAGDNRLLGVWGIGGDIWAVGFYKVPAGIGASFISPSSCITTAFAGRSSREIRRQTADA
jgi:hypothetical protein